MATRKQRLLYFLRNFVRFLLQRARGIRLQVLSSIWKVIAALLSKLGLWRKPKIKDKEDREPPSKVDELEKTIVASTLDAVKGFQDKCDTEPLERAAEYQHQPHQLESISLADVACSLRPYEAEGLRTASRSSHNLEASRSAHSSRTSLKLPDNSSSRSRISIDSTTNMSNPRIAIRGPTMSDPPTQGDAYSPNNDNIFGIENGQTFAEPDTIELQERTPEPPQETNLGGQSSPRRPLSRRSTASRNTPLQVAILEVNTGEKQLGRPWIIPVMPIASRRYKPKPKIEWECKENVYFSALKMDYDEPIPPTTWTRYITIEGARYFSRKWGDMNIWTEANILDDMISSHLEDDIGIIEGFIAENNILLPPKCDLVLDSLENEDTAYYFVNHTKQLIFFLDNYQAEDLDAWAEAPGAESMCHIRYEIESQYWYFALLFPHALHVTRSMVQKLRGHVLHYLGDTLTSSTAHVPFAPDDLYKMLNLIDHIKENVDIDDDGSASILARFMSFFSHERFLNFHGEGHARLDRITSLYGNPIYLRTWFVSTLSPLLFYAPDFHLRTLQSMWVDQIMRQAVFKDLMEKMIDEWQQFILFATVMLNANVAFLAIQSVDNDDSSDPYRSQAQIFSYLSVVASIGSILLGLLLVREFKTKDRESIKEIREFVESRSRHHSKLGLEILAILFSLPYALLTWGMVSFLVAFASLCFKTSTISTRATVGSAAVMVALLVALCVSTNWDKQKKSAQRRSRSSHQTATGAQDTDTQNTEDAAQRRYLPAWLPTMPLFRSRTSSSSQRTAVATTSGPYAV